MRAVLACGLLLSSFTASAGVEAATFNKGEFNGNYETTDWMKHIPGSTYVCHMSIPGTHDTATGEGFTLGAIYAASAQTQNKSIQEQIEGGIRAIDLRPAMHSGHLTCCHGIAVTKKSLESAIDDLKTFLEKHPTEFILIHMLKVNDDNDYKSEIYKFFNQDKYAGLFVNFRRDLTVDDMRGKILVFNRNEDAPVPYGGDLIWWHEQGYNFEKNQFEDAFIRSYNPAGEGYARLYTQDVAETNGSALDTKLEQINKLIDYTINTNPQYPDECEWFFNFTSAYKASTSSPKAYAENASYTNPTILNRIREKQGTIGIVLMDWACNDNGSYGSGLSKFNGDVKSQSLTYALIENNYRYIGWVEDGRENAYSRTMYPMYSNVGDNPEWTPVDDNSIFLANRRGGAVMADFDNNDMLDIYNSGQWHNSFYEGTGWSWQAQSNLYYNMDGGKTWERDIIGSAGERPKSDIAPLIFPHFATLDYNNDGKVDLLVMGLTNGDDWLSYRDRINCKKIKDKGDYAAFLLYKNLGDGKFELEANFDVPTYYLRFGDNSGWTSVMHPIAVGDFDHDGYVDIAVSGMRLDADHENTGNVDGVQESALYRNMGGTGSFERVDGGFSNIGGSAYMADFNNDGWLDLLFTGWGETNGRLYRNLGNGSFSDMTGTKAHFTRHGTDGIADFNNDGYLDFMSMGWSDVRWAYKAMVYMNNVTDTPFDIYQDINNYCGHGEAGEPYNMYLGDYNGDGHIDIMYDGRHDDAVVRGTSPTSFDGNYTPFPVRGHNNVDGYMALGDVTGNGLADRFQAGQFWCEERYRNQLFGTDGDWVEEHTLWLNSVGGGVGAPWSPSAVSASYANGYITVEWTDLDDMSVGYNVVITNMTDGTVIANIPVNPETGKLRVAQGKEVCVRPGVRVYSVKVGDDLNIADYKAGVQAVSLVNETASSITWCYFESEVGELPDFNDTATLWGVNAETNSVFLPVEKSNSIIADFNGDGLMDIYNSGATDGDVSFYPTFGKQHQSNMYYQNSDNSFTREAIEDINGQFVTPKHDIAPLKYPHFVTFDYDNDGKLDLFACGLLTENDRTWYKDNIPGKHITSTVGDETLDLWAVTLIYRNNGDGTFSYLENTGLPVVYVRDDGNHHKGHTQYFKPIAIGDYDHDGNADIAIMAMEVADNGAENQLAALYRNNGDGTFSKMDIVDGNKAFHTVYAGNVNFADLNNDGWLDLVFDGSVDNPGIENFGGGSGCRIYLNNQGKSFTDITATLADPYAARNAGTAIADMDGDGRLDIINIGYADHGLGWGMFCFHNTGNTENNLLVRNNLSGVEADEHCNVYVRDFNNDGLLDIVFDGTHENRTFYGNSDTDFTMGLQLPIRTNQPHNSSMALGDINGNGLTDRFETGYMWTMNEYRKPMGYDEWGYTATLYENRGGESAGDAVAQPLTPNVTLAGWLGGKLIARWEDVDDPTVAYNVVFRTPDGKVYSNLPVTADGKLMVCESKHTAVRPGVGEYSISHPEVLRRNAPARAGSSMPGYSIGVQAVSLRNESTSPIAWYDNVTAIDDITVSSNVTVSVIGDAINVEAADDCDVKVTDLLGRTVATGVANTPIEVRAGGVFIVEAAGKVFKVSK